MKKENTRRARRNVRRFLQREKKRAIDSGKSKPDAIVHAHSKLIEREAAKIQQRRVQLNLNVDDRFPPEERLRAQSDKGNPFVDSVHGCFERHRIKVRDTKSRVKVRHVKEQPGLSRGAIKATERKMDRNVVRKSRRRSVELSAFDNAALSPVYQVAGYGMEPVGTLHSGTTTILVPVDPAATCAQTASPLAIDANGRPKWVDVPIETWLQNGQ